jgi:hypothetical protein
MSDDDLKKPTTELGFEQLRKRRDAMIAYIKAHPTAPYSKFIKDTGFQISNPSYFTARTKLFKTKSSKSKTPKTSRFTKLEKLKEFIKDNPDATYSDFQKECPSLKVSKYAYTYHCRKLFGPRRIKPGRGGRIYKTLWSRPTQKMTKQTKVILSEIVKLLNEGGRTRWQLVEIKNPQLIEIREEE